jgi:hypothetical protein
MVEYLFEVSDRNFQVRIARRAPAIAALQVVARHNLYGEAEPGDACHAASSGQTIGGVVATTSGRGPNARKAAGKSLGRSYVSD